MPKYLGCDVGTKTIGLAISDDRGIIATPLETVRRTKFTHDLEHMKRIITDYAIEALVIGLPVHMDGSAGSRVQSIRAFARNMTHATGLIVHFWDERLSTSAVQRIMLEADLSRAKRAQHVDKLAAAYILQGFLDAQGYEALHI
ncbi:MAG: Holliday junction resolvase RuvX [Alphaproteobacteria bacterium]|nr:MAG: Holliday junction resolvase RuvX [Alphaproteobacteria bacterium]TAF15503.1 MAG: Holliday junction resolvase RuvX [Alphaproteobacteria bacterium]TAF40954.1 MAG: Holliday junction resolvase RuvX [Alphaproteobacteria bacterium]